MVFGCKALAQAFSSIRREILCLPRTRTDLAIEVVKMRHKMREHLGSHEDGVFDLKQDEGGIADIEFLAQYLVLGFGHQYPDMAFWPDNVRIFETAKTLKLLTQEQADQLIAAYCNYRIRSHRLSLQCEKIKVTDSEFSHEKSQVKAIWQLFFADAECALADS